MPVSALTRRTSAIRSACSSGVPCEQLTRATRIPARTIAVSTAGPSDAGPRVQTIFVRGISQIFGKRAGDSCRALGWYNK
ncbi:MAG: hypothetical protein BWY76_01754 [bacterium ADurb.Bin429]|nr:MAG: hypothetical protein BWY76_01754 [bacterium ADurb.Bin429]